MQAESDNQQTILIVDDSPENLDVLGGILRDKYKVQAAISGELALKIANAPAKPDMVLLDIMMPEMDGFEVCRQLKANPATHDIPVIFVTAKTEVSDEKLGFSLGAVDYITKPISPPRVMARVHTHLALYDQQRELSRQVRQRTQELANTQQQVINRLGRAAEYKDNETGMHVIRMSYYTQFLAEAAGYSGEWVDLLQQAAPMHDIGKIGIADKILLKPGKLDTEEWTEMQRHVEYGGNIIGDDDSQLLIMAKEIALGHHEKWNGEGYPKGIAGDDIPLSARIVAIADVFDALTSVRPYKEAWPIEKALNLIEEEAGQHFDPKLAPLFRQCLPRVEKIMRQYQDTF